MDKFIQARLIADVVPRLTRQWREGAWIGLLESIPATAKLYLAGPQHLDPALVTQVVLSSDRHLSPGLKEALAAFVGAEQARNEHSIRQSYTDRDEAFEAFKAKLFRTPK